MVHLDSYIKAQQIIPLKKCWLDYPSKWKLILNFHLKDCGRNFLLQCNPHLTLLKNGIPPFYLNCLKTWFSFQPPITSYEADIICNEIVWNNKCILIDKNTVYSKSLKHKAVLQKQMSFYRADLPMLKLFP